MPTYLLNAVDTDSLEPCQIFIWNFGVFKQGRVKHSQNELAACFDVYSTLFSATGDTYFSLTEQLQAFFSFTEIFPK